MAKIDSAKQRLRLEIDRPNVLRQVFQAVKKGGTVSVIGVYAGFIDTFPSALGSDARLQDLQWQGGWVREVRVDAVI